MLTEIRMKRILLGSALVALWSTAGCFQVDLANVTLLCDPVQPDACPESQECSPSKKVCIPVGTEVAEVADLASPPDLAEKPFQPMPAEGCQSGLGYELTVAGKPKAYACPGKFSTLNGRTADVQCASPYTLCTTADNVNLSLCSMIGQSAAGFFISLGQGYIALGKATCGAPPASQTSIWAGCGRPLGSRLLPCAGFARGVECTTSGSVFTCAGTKITDVTNSDVNSGVLCCHP